MLIVLPWRHGLEHVAMVTCSNGIGMCYHWDI